MYGVQQGNKTLSTPSYHSGGVEAPTDTNNSIIHIPSALRPFLDRGIFVVSTADLKQLKHKKVMKKAITYEAPELMVFEIHTVGTLCQSQSYGEEGQAGNPVETDEYGEDF